MGRCGVTSRKVREQMEIERHDVERAVNKLQNGRAPVNDRITNKMVKGGVLAIIEWLVCLSNLYMNIGSVPLD
jgi:hypothetical protein